MDQDQYARMQMQGGSIDGLEAQKRAYEEATATSRAALATAKEVIADCQAKMREVPLADQALRLRCLELACQILQGDPSYKDHVHWAKAFYAFVSGEGGSDAVR